MPNTHREEEKVIKVNKHEKCFNGLMKEMYEVPGVEEHMNKFEVQMSKKIMLRQPR